MVSAGRRRLPPDVDQVIGDLRDHRHLRSRARQDGRVDATPCRRRRGRSGGSMEAGEWTFKWDDDGQEQVLRNTRTREHRNAMVPRQVRRIAHMRERHGFERGGLMSRARDGSRLPGGRMAGTRHPTQRRGGAGALPQRGGGHRRGGGRFPCRPARGPRICVFDNASTDGTAATARAAGAEVLGVARPQARGTWCGGCSPTSRPTSTSWPTVTAPMTPRASQTLVDYLIDWQLDMVVGTRVPAGAGQPNSASATSSATGC